MADDLIVVAVLLGAHGVRGDCRVKSFTGEADAVLAYGSLYDAGGAVLLTPLRARMVKDHFIVTPEETRQKEAWDALKGTLLHVPRAVLPATGDDEVYIDELIGVAVFDGEGQSLGCVKAVHNFGAGDLLEIDCAAGGKTVMVPFTEEDVPEIDLDIGQIVIVTFDLWADESGAPGQDTNDGDNSPPEDAGKLNKKLKR